jgi:hypothetical protein
VLLNAETYRYPRKTSVTLSNRISGDQDGDASLVGSVLSQHGSKFYALATESPHASIRLAALELIGHLLRQGLINPMETVPHLLALQGDVAHAPIRHLALQLLCREGEKRPDMLRQRVCAGIQRAYEFQSRHTAGGAGTMSTENVVAVTWVEDSGGGAGHRKLECVFARIYKESLSSSKVQKQALFKSLLGLFTTLNTGTSGSSGRRRGNATMLEDSTTQEDQEGGAGPNKTNNKRAGNKNKNNATTNSTTQDHLVSKIPLWCYASQMLAHLPYTSSADVLFVIHHMTNLVSLEGDQLLDQFAQLLGPFVDDIVDDEDVDVVQVQLTERQDGSTKVVMTKSPVKKNMNHNNPNSNNADAPQAQSIYDDPNTRENALEKAGLKAKFPSRAKAAKFLQSESTDAGDHANVDTSTSPIPFTSDKLHQLVALCARASALLLLMRLRTFLKRMYALNETRCLEYNPAEKVVKIQDRGINVDMGAMGSGSTQPIFVNRIPSFFVVATTTKEEEEEAVGKKEQMSSSPCKKNKHKNSTISATWNMDSLIQVYAEFRRSLRSAGDWTTSTGTALGHDMMQAAEEQGDDDDHGMMMEPHNDGIMHGGDGMAGHLPHGAEMAMGMGMGMPITYAAVNAAPTKKRGRPKSVQHASGPPLPKTNKKKRKIVADSDDDGDDSDDAFPSPEQKRQKQHQQQQQHQTTRHRKQNTKPQRQPQQQRQQLQGQQQHHSVLL